MTLIGVVTLQVRIDPVTTIPATLIPIMLLADRVDQPAPVVVPAELAIPDLLEPEGLPVVVVPCL
jgi:hypothetical protein